MPLSLAGERHQEPTVNKLPGHFGIGYPLTEATRRWRHRRDKVAKAQAKHHAEVFLPSETIDIDTVDQTVDQLVPLDGV